MSVTEDYLVSLYDSKICRLCGEQNPNGYPLYAGEDAEGHLSQKINTYLPLRISDDGIFPRWICPGCHLQVESTVQFFTLILAGQDILRMLHKECQQKCSGLTSISPSVDDPAEKNDEVIPIIFEIPEFLYPSDHELLQTPTPVKRKRGRPRKSEKNKLENVPTPAESPVGVENDQGRSNPTSNGRQKRRIKIPSRYQESVKGSELERVYADMGLTEKSGGLDSLIHSTDGAKEPKANASEQLIGHVEDDKGVNLGDLIVVKLDGKSKRQKNNAHKTKTRFMCDICKVCFWQEQKFLQHRFSHHSVSFECIQCLKSFKDRKYLIQHQLVESHSGEGLIEDPDPKITDCDLKQQLEDFNDSKPIVEFHDLTSENSIINLGDLSQIDEMGNMVKVHLKINHSEDSKQGTSTSQYSTTQPQSAILLSTIGDDNCLENTENELKLENSQNELNLENTQNEINLENTHNELNLENFEKFTCKQCKMEFVEFAAYIDHKKNDHNIGRRFICSKCKRRFNTKTLLQRHQVVHSEQRPHICTICSATFKTKTNLVNHRVKHSNQKKFSCKICDQKFVHKHSLKLHLRLHSGSKPFKCTQCGKGFNQHGNMQEHLRVHTGERPFQCSICPKRFKTSSQCRIHIKRHEVIRPLKCSKCEKTFLSREDLKVHERRHDNIKPFKCGQCEKSFIDMPALRKHSRLHTGEKPFSCLVCGKHFADRSNLNKHQKMHENKTKNNDLLLSQDDQGSNDGVAKLVADLTASSFDAKSLILCDVNTTGDESVWNVIDDCIKNPSKLDENEPLIKTDDIAATKQVVYVTYQDPNNPVDNKTTLYVVE